MRLCGPDMGVLVITHYPRILEYLRPDRVHVLHDGRVVTSGGPDLAQTDRARGLRANSRDGRGRHRVGGFAMAIQARELTKDYQYGFSDVDVSVFRTAKGLSPEVVASISKHKNEPEWMLKFRLKALDHFRKRPMPNWGADLSGLDFENIYYYVKPVEEMSRSWDDVPDSIKNTFDRLGIPQAERKFLAGVSAQYDSEVVYHSIREDLEKQGVLFSDCDTGLREHEELFRKYFGTVIPPNDNKFAALNSAVWSGGSFVYVPKGVKVDIPLQAYFRINSDNMGQFERTLIIADEGSSVHYIEGCTAPELLERLAAQRGRRADRAQGREDPLHDHPELVRQRLQPGHQAGHRQRGRDRRVDRRQPRVEGDHEVPVRVPDGRARARRGDERRVRRRRSAPGRREQGDPRGAEHHEQHRVPLDQQGQRPHVLPRPHQGAARRRTTSR